MLKISEEFFSIQGEGPYVGQPSLFLRLSGCNLLCGGEGTIESKACENGATWRCDTIEVWLKGTKVSNTDILNNWQKKGWVEKLKNGAHLIITGGEPLLQQQAIVGLLTEIKERYGFLPKIEIETNGTISVEANLKTFNCHYNISPKLANSGMSIEKCQNAEALSYFSEIQASVFKFVISHETDIIDCQSTYIDKFQLPHHKIMLMPGASDRKILNTLEPELIQLCLQHNYRYSTRLHIQVWNKKTGV